MKKLRYLLLSLIVITCMVLSACSGGGNSTSGKKGGIGGEITIWGWDVAAKSLQDAVKGFNKKYPDVKVKVQNYSASEVYDKLTVGLQARGKGLPDIVMLEDGEFPSYTNEFPDGFVNLSKLGYDKYADIFSSSKIAELKNSKGDLLAAPWDIGPAGVFYRVDLFKKAGVNPDSIKTWKDYIEGGKKIQAKTGAKMLPIDISNSTEIYEMMLQEQGIMYTDKKGKVMLTSDKAQKAMNVLKELNDNKLIDNVSGWNGLVTATVNGSVATVPYGVWYSGSIKDQAPKLKGKWGVFYLPAFEGSKGRFANSGGSSLLIPSSSDNQKTAYAFLKYFTTNKDVQMEAFKDYGLFPSLLETYNDPYFDKKSPFFNNQKVYRLFADEVEKVPAVNVTANYKRSSKFVADAQAAILIRHKSVKKGLTQAAEQMKNITSR
ncbi:carbohydrate ABC transporter substrate-binding protein (CUT1 family) [Scopulibacillus darangshiensis]|uniref:Carbohydrate ABC transporter substrate-binding protein (CUT1 family) n=1 Tax=Scopulibacillus darangshiensis TaxID=442528 RepID=A0A4R2P4E0_9BACL|nr:sugar ABC transporter substrate-binding protein [Scopulibacillus darangshiensis]TCP29612.1 carbohydrate ABC transporter substrate-binding protein (CUT1 family) [Scopulibacillus darangshiensis]